MFDFDYDLLEDDKPSASAAGGAIFDYDFLKDDEPAGGAMFDCDLLEDDEAWASSATDAAPAASPPEPACRSSLSTPSGPSSSQVMVEVSTIGAGVVAKFLVPRAGLVEDVRQELEKRRGVAAAEQHLLHGTAVLDASERLLDVARGTVGPLQLTMVHVQGARRVALSGSREGALLLWDLCNGEPLRRLAADDGSRVTCVDMDWPRRRALSGGGDGLLRIWNLERASVARALRGHGAAVTCLAADWEALRGVSGCQDGSIRYWDLDCCSTILELAGHADAVLCIAFDVQEQRAVSGGVDCSLIVWDLEEGGEAFRLEGHTMPINCVAAKLDATPEPFAVTGSFGILRVWTLSHYSFHWDIPGQASVVTCVSVDWGTESILCGSVDTTLLCGKLNLNRNTIEGQKRLRGHTAPVNCVAAEWSRRRAASGGEDGSVRVWDLRSGRALQELRGHGDGVLCVALSLDGRAEEGYEDGDALELLTSLPNLAHRCLAKASSSNAYSRAASFAVDGRRGTRWTSAYLDDQWLCVDLAKPCKVSRVDIKWEACCAKLYSLQGSLDGEVWRPLAIEEGRQGWVVTELPPETCLRWLRMYGHTRATRLGFSLWALCVF